MCVFLATLILFIGLVLMTKPVINSPIYEIKLFYIGIFICTLSFSFYCLAAINSNPGRLITNQIALYDRLGYFFSMIGILFLGYAFILPNFKLSYSDLILISFISSFGVSSAFVNAITEELTIKGIYFKTTHNIYGLLINYAFLLIIFYIIIRRVYEIFKISKNLSTKNKSNSFMTVLLILFVISFLISILTNVVLTEQLLPSNFYYLILSISFLFFLYFFLRDNSFFFLTPVSLDAIIIAHKKTGVTIYSESYKDNFRVDDLLSSIFSLLNISLQEFLIAKKELEEVTFADKTVIIVPGRMISSILIVSGKNFIVTKLARVMTTKFEHLFKIELEKSSEKNVFNRTKFLSFNNYTQVIREYLPL